MTINVGILGCGSIAQFHARSWQAAPDVKIVACADIIPERAKEYAEKYNIPNHYNCLEDMLDAGGFEAMSVCTPNYFHAEPAVAALKQGLHVISEKPMAMSVDECRSMVLAARESKKLLTIGHNSRYVPASLLLKQMVEAGELGELYHAKCQCLRRRGMPGWGAFHIKAKSGGGPLIDIGVHALDLTMWLLGSPEPVSVCGVTYCKIADREDYWNPWGNDYKRSDYDVEDYASGLIRLAGNMTLQVEASFVAHIPRDEYYQQLMGTDGGALLRPHPGKDEPNLLMLTNKGKTEVNGSMSGFPEVDSYAEEMKYFSEAIRGEHDVLVKPEETLRVQKILNAMYMSSEAGKEISVLDAFGKDPWD
ncbi:Gfo/Idh/MocA family oxidoreductase [Candidatus Sumerlaeota bacterium]|nr:Gfo/Idh/MocA family oxidoreductase [Candidatus Sumerlaeota bacterium]